MFRANSFFLIRNVSLHEFKSIVLNNLHKEIIAKKLAKDPKSYSSKPPTQSSNHVLIDVRELNELRNYGHVPFALHVPLQELQDVLLDAAEVGRERKKNPDYLKDHFPNEAAPEHDVMEDPVLEIGAPGEKQLIFFCGHGMRSQYALSIAESCGYRENCCAHLPGGFTEYNQDPVTKEDVEQFVSEKEGKGDKK